MKPKGRQAGRALADSEAGHARPPDGVDSEEAKIFRQSLPAEEVTRDFLQELLEEHRVNQQRN